MKSLAIYPRTENLSEIPSNLHNKNSLSIYIAAIDYVPVELANARKASHAYAVSYDDINFNQTLDLTTVNIKDHIICACIHVCVTHTLSPWCPW